MAIVQERITVQDGFEKETSTVAKYNVGCEIAVAVDGLAIPTVYRYVKATANLTANVPCVLVNNADGVGTATPATSTVAKIVGIPQVAIAKDSYGFVAIGGACKAVCGVAAKGDTLEVLNGGTTLVVDGTTGSPAETNNTVAIACEAATAGKTIAVNLLNKRVAIAAS